MSRLPTEDAAAIEQAEQTALRAGKRRPAVLAAIEAVKNAARLPIDEGLAQERAVFQQLRVSTEAYALRHQFFAEREAAKLPAALQAAPRPVQTVAVIGAGTMGAGIAICALDAGLNVILLEQDDAALQRGQQRVAEHYQSRVAAGKVKAAVAAASEARLSPTHRLGAAGAGRPGHRGGVRGPGRQAGRLQENRCPCAARRGAGHQHLLPGRGCDCQR